MSARGRLTDSEVVPSRSHGTTRDLPLVWTLRLLGGIDMLALIAVVMPASWINAGHEWAGLGEFPDTVIANYLARSASALYALHGLLVVYMSFDVRRYGPLIRFLASIALLHGGVMFCIDLAVRMPTWWLVVEGPAFAATGIAVLAAQHLCRDNGE